VELLSIAAVIPAVIFLIKQNPIEKFLFLEPILKYFLLMSKYDVVLYSLIFITIIYFIRFLFLIFLNYYKNLFSYYLSLEIKSELVNKYLS